MMVVKIPVKMQKHKWWKFAIQQAAELSEWLNETRYDLTKEKAGAPTKLDQEKLRDDGDDEYAGDYIGHEHGLDETLSCAPHRQDSVLELHHSHPSGWTSPILNFN